MLMKSFQQQFMESMGKPIQYNGKLVLQGDVLSIPESALVTISFAGEKAFQDNGLILKASGGRILLNDGRSVESLKIWDSDRFPRSVTYEVYAPNRELRVWNIYRITHRSGLITEDSWTGNAGMLVELRSNNVRRYRCSNSIGEPTFAALVFDLTCEHKEQA